VDFLQQLQEQIKKIWLNFSKTQRKVVIGGTLLVFSLLIILTFFFGKTEYELLYPNLSITDSATIVSKLKEMKVDYKLGKDGTSILVPSSLKYQLRLDLASELPEGGVIGFESFNKTRFGETDTDKRVRYLAALQGELTRTIQEMAEVESAKVHIVLPEPSLFISENKPATASVLLKLKPYVNMDKQKVRSIIYFLSHSVEGLDPVNVTVIDVYGNLLSEGVVNEAGEQNNPSLTVTQMDVKKKFEDDLAKSLQTMLERVKGSGKAVVRASVELDFDQVETSKEEYGDKVLRSEQIKEETSEGLTTSDSGIPGTASNLPDTPTYQAGENGETSSESSEIIRNYEISKVIENRKKAPGEIKRMSVAVILDGQLSTEEENEIKKIIAKAAGINEERGDSVEITSLPFNTESYTKMQEQLEKETSRQRMMELIKYGVLGLGILTVFILVFFLLRRTTSRIIQPQEALQKSVINYEEMYDQLSPEDQEKIQVQKRIEKIAKTQPDNVAKVIRTWLAEDSR